MRSVLPILITSLLFISCGQKSLKTNDYVEGVRNSTSDEPAINNNASGKAKIRYCNKSTELSTAANEEWRHVENFAAAEAFEIHNEIPDFILNSDSSINLSGKFRFAHNILQKPVKDEFIQIYLDVCSEKSKFLGKVLTDNNGNINFALEPDLIHNLSTGAYKIHFYVAKKKTGFSSYLRVLPPETKIIVSDIDGTLTKSETNLFKDILKDFYLPLFQNGAKSELRAGAAETLSLLHEKFGYEIVYLTGRPVFLQSLTRTWLKENKFPLGTTHFTQFIEETVPNMDGVGAYKIAYLDSLHELFKARTHYALGNTEVDISAYLEAGIRPGNIYITGKHGGKENTVGMGEDFNKILSELKSIKN